jgi:glutamate-1-semialdehyde 2,1-aminomutase
MNQTRSQELFNRSQKLMPGGVNSPVRSFNGVGGVPPFIAKGLGSKVWDVDGNEYLDFLGSWGPLILGHANPVIVDAIKSAALEGTSFGAPTEKELLLAELISTAIPSIEMLRLVSSGTEATMSAIRIARAYTNRNKLIKFNGNYHGHSDGLLVKAGSGAATHGVPTSAGVPASYASETLVAEFNDLNSVVELIDENINQIAAIIVEPIAGNMGVVKPRNGFLQGLRKLCDQNGILLIFDEVITGFRVSYGGAQNLYGVSPDLTCLGKIIGGGLPVGAYGGKREIMKMVSPLGPSYQAGTLSGNPLAVSAGIACLSKLSEPKTYEALEALGARAEEGLYKAAALANLPIQINRVGSMFTVFFANEKVCSWAGAAASDTSAYSKYFHHLLDSGIYVAPSQFECGFVSLAHTQNEIDTMAGIAKIAFSELTAN